MPVGRFARAGGRPAVSARVCLLDADPDLGRHIASTEFPRARGALVAPLFTLEPGPLASSALAHASKGLGLLVLDGVICRRTSLGGRATSELLGESDLVGAPAEGLLDESVVGEVGWRVCSATPVLFLDVDFVRQAAAWPTVLSELVARSQRQADRLALRMTMLEVAGIELRVQLLLWHLADRWGRVERAGVSVRPPVGQTTLGEMVGLSRSRVNATLRLLEGRGALERRPDGALLLCGPRPEALLASTGVGPARR